MTKKYGTDISPAILELKKLHNMLLDHVEKKSGTATNLHKPGVIAARETVISILPGERRREDGWYKWRVWEKKSDSILHELDNHHKVQKYHEIFVAGEALQGEMEDIVLLMMHQVAHQSASIQSTQSYHSEWIKIWYERLFDIPNEAVIRDEVMGWYHIDKTKLGKAGTLVRTLASRLEPSKFDLFRLKLSQSTKTGKMYKWQCNCAHPVVRTGGILRAICQQCNSWYKLDTRGVREDFLRRVPNELIRG